MAKTNGKVVWVVAKRLEYKFVGHLMWDSGAQMEWDFDNLGPA